MNLKLLTISAAILTLALFISGCGAKPHETPKQAVTLTDASVGDIVVFGDIRWYVIAKTADGCTLLSEKPVIKKAFRDAEYQAFDGTWERSTLRAWLNGQFYDTFTEAEKALIVLADKDETVERAAANIPGVKTTLVGTLNTYEVLKYKKLILTKDSVAKIEEVYV